MRAHEVDYTLPLIQKVVAVDSGHSKVTEPILNVQFRQTWALDTNSSKNKAEFQRKGRLQRQHENVKQNETGTKPQKKIRREVKVIFVKLKGSALLTPKPPLDMILRKFHPPLIQVTYLTKNRLHVIIS
jgi:hypothetical protein